MEFYNPGHIPWLDSQLIYHALAELNREALCLVSPAEPYVCIGFHQDVDHEVDLDFCRANNIPVFRREVGGGAVYLDGRQLFFQLILHRDDPNLPRRREAFYQRFLSPIITVHHRLGLPAQFKPVNDLVVNGRKISGAGAGEIGDCVVFVGNLILDFDFETMSKVLKVPDEKFRDKVKKTIQENMTTIKRELGEDEAGRYSEADLNGMMAEELGTLVGPLEPMEMDGRLREKMRELEARMHTDEWLHRRGRVRNGRMVKIKSGLEAVHRMHKARGGLIRFDCLLEEGMISGVNISGDFFSYPKDAVNKLEGLLEGCPVQDAAVRLDQFLSGNNYETPGVERDDWLAVLSF